MGDEHDFIKKFHNLEGDLISERKKNFSKLLKTSNLFQNEEQLCKTLQNLKPSNYQENINYIETLIYFKRNSELLEILKDGNELFASKIIKQHWFIEKEFKEIDPDKFVNDFLPQLAFSIRKKIITRILSCWDETKIDVLFDSLDKKYGLPVAIPVLQKCSPTKIKNVLEENELQLRPSQIMLFLKINDELFKMYVEHSNKLNKNMFANDKILNYLARKNPNLFLELEKEKKIQPYILSKRNTKKFVAIVKDDILSNGARYFTYFHKAVAIRKLGRDFETLYKNLQLQELHSIRNYDTSWLIYYPKSRRWNLFIETCQEGFPGKNLDKILLEYGKNIRNLKPPKEVFQKWAELHYQEQGWNYESYLQYYLPSIGIPIIKERINITSDISKRGNLIQYMLQSAAEHKDLEALEKILQYICFRHRNEDANFRNRILDEISTHFKWEDLNANHWKCIKEQIQILKLQHQFYFWKNGVFLERHLEFLFKNKMDYMTELVEYVKDSLNDSLRTLDLSNPPIKQQIYTEICKHLSEAVPKDSTDFNHNLSGILDKFLNFMIITPEYCINLSELPDVLHYIKQIFTNTQKFNEDQKRVIPKVIIYKIKFPQFDIDVEDSSILNVLTLLTSQEKCTSVMFDILTQFLVKRSDRSQLVNEMFNLYFESVYVTDVVIVNWFLRHEPKTLLPYIDKLVAHTAKTSQPLDFKTIRNYSYLNLDKTVSTVCLDKLEDTEITDKKRFLIGLSTLLSTEAFRQLVEENYLPKKDKLDLEDKEMLLIYNLQCQIIKFLSNVPDPYRMLPTIMKFCRGDYLQSVLRSLYKAFYRSPERILYTYVEDLSNMAVSVRKHAIFLSCAVLDKEHTLKLLKTTKEVNPSSQKHLFSATLKYFLKNPSRDLLDKVVESMNTVDKNDTETLERLKCVSMPAKYRSYYVENCWGFFEGLKSSGVKVKGHLEQLLNFMSGKLLNSLSEEFLTKIINRYFVVETSKRLSGIDDFVVRILKNLKPAQTYYLNLVTDLLKSAKESTVRKFFQTFLSVFRDKEVDVNLINSFSDHWNQHFSKIDYLNEYFQFDLRKLRLDKPSNDEYAIRLVDYLDQQITLYGLHIYAKFKENFIGVYWEIDDMEQLSFLQEILKYKLDPTTCLLVMEVLDPRFKSRSDKLIYDSLLDILKNVESPVVQVYFKAFMERQSKEEVPGIRIRPMVCSMPPMCC